MTATTFTEGIQESLLPWASPGSDFDLYNQCLGAMFETVFGVVADQGSPDVPDTYQAGWSILLDPTACAATFPLFLPWLALFVGAVVPIGAAEGTALASILGEQGFARGQGFGGTYDTATGVQGGAIVTAAQSQLTGSQSVALLERTSASGSPDPYHFVLIVRPEQIVSLAAIEAAVSAVKPAGIQFTIVQSDAPLLSQYTRLFSAITATLGAAVLADVT